MLKKIDLYIIKKFLGTYVLSIILIISISVVFDLTEKLDNFFDNNAPLKAIVFDYYLNFIPYYANMFTPLFTFISVIFFTSKMASNTEIIAILASGVKFSRLLWPYFISAASIALFSFFLTGYVIPPANKTRLEFEDQYIKKFKNEVARNIQFEIKEGTIIYIERYEEARKRGYRFSMESFENDKSLSSRLIANRIEWKSDSTWVINDYLIRTFDGLYESIVQGETMDTIIPMNPAEFFITAEQAPEMTNPQLKEYIEKQEKRGAANIQAFKDEYYKRFSYPLASFILTLIGVSLASRKVKGGIGLHLGIGIGLSATFILFSTISSTFAIKGTMSPLLAVWLPNIIFLIIGIVLYQKAPK